MSFISPLDLLTISSNEQDVIRCLVRRPQLTAVEIAHFTKIPLEELENLLNRMVQDSRLMRDDQNKFQVPLGREKKRERSNTGLLETFFE